MLTFFTNLKPFKVAEKKEKLVKVEVIKSHHTMAYTAGHTYEVTATEKAKMQKLKMLSAKK